jgi:hypothetical protein
MHLTSLALALTLLPICRLTAFTTTPCDYRELARIRIVNDAGGEVAASYDGGQTWTPVGRVLRYTTRANPRGYTASKWVAAGRVAATAVNAIHVSVGYNQEDERGVIFSLLPREFLTPMEGYNSFLSPNSSIYTDISAGEGIFGGGIAPLVGNPVYLEVDESRLRPLPGGYHPGRGDILVIAVLRPDLYPVAAQFENREGGAITLRYPDGSRRLLGWVIRPVRGIGRFAGSLYSDIGRIRAGHAGVVDISTSPPGFLGAFQVIPVGHALSPEMHYAWSKTQWMIVGPAEAESPLWEGLMPLFYQHIRPDYLATDLYSRAWRARLLARFLVEVDEGDGWEPMPCFRLPPDPTTPLPAWADSALDGVCRLRILFPVDSGAKGEEAERAAVPDGMPCHKAQGGR